MGKHSILVIKNRDDKYLQYFDEVWNSWLFLNSKVKGSEDTDSIIELLCNRFAVQVDAISMNMVGERRHSKFSESAKLVKEYVHYFYDVKFLVEVPEFNEENFEIDGIRYQWFSYDELLSDLRIQEVNSDIVGYIKELKL